MKKHDLTRPFVGGLVSANLVIVLAVITVGMAALAYEWCHAQTVKTHQRSAQEQMQKR